MNATADAPSLQVQRPERILLVDDDQHLLDAMRRQFHRQFALTVACGPEQGLGMLESQGPFAVIVSDYKMPGMDGITFLDHTRRLCPDTVRIMLTGHADMHAAIDAVNRGHIFRFLTKPCDKDLLEHGLDAAISQYRLLDAERQLLEQTLLGSIQVLRDLLALVNPLAFGRAKRVEFYVRQIVSKLKLERAWEYETAASLSQIGCVSLPADLIERSAAGEPLGVEEAAMLEGHPRVAQRILARIPRLDRVAEMVGDHRILPGASSPETLGGRLLSLALHFDDLVSRGRSKSEAVGIVCRRRDLYGSELLDVVPYLELPGQNSVVCTLPMRDVHAGMIIDQDVCGTNGALVVARGAEITIGMLERLRNYARIGRIDDSLRVRVPR